MKGRESGKTKNKKRTKGAWKRGIRMGLIIFLIIFLIRLIGIVVIWLLIGLVFSYKIVYLDNLGQSDKTEDEKELDREFGVAVQDDEISDDEKRLAFVKGTLLGVITAIGYIIDEKNKGKK